MSESVDESLQMEKTLLKFITKLTKIPFFHFLLSSKCVKIARSATQRNPVN